MPKRSRQAHIPSQIHKRKVRRAFGLDDERNAQTDQSQRQLEPNFADDAPISSLGGAFGGASGPVDTRPRMGGRRLEMLARGREPTSVRVIPGQLPVFERSYLLTELRRISMISTSLLVLIIVLALLLR